MLWNCINTWRMAMVYELKLWGLKSGLDTNSHTHTKHRTNSQYNSFASIILIQFHSSSFEEAICNHTILHIFGIDIGFVFACNCAACSGGLLVLKKPCIVNFVIRLRQLEIFAVFLVGYRQSIGGRIPIRYQARASFIFWIVPHIFFWSESYSVSVSLSLSRSF